MTTNPVETTRTTHHIALGVDKAEVDSATIDQAYEYLKIEIARHSGGVTSFKSEGIWFPEYELGDLAGDVEHDITLNFLVTLTIEEELYGVWDQIKIGITNAVRMFNLGCQHVHCTAWWSQARHFRSDSVLISNDNCGTKNRGNTKDDDDKDAA